jgi:predicted nucleic-acid-binding protein
MFGLDTNVLVRLLVQDDAQQAHVARQRISKESKILRPVLVNSLVLMETEWVLRSRYEMTKAQIFSAFTALLETIDLAFEDERAFEEAMYVWQHSKAGFTDCLIGAKNRNLGCDSTLTFDVVAAQTEFFQEL